MSVKFDQTNEAQWLKADGSALAPSFTSSIDGFSVSLWVYFETLPEGGSIRVIWWFGDKDVSNEYVRLEYVVSTKKFRVTCGAGYSAIGAVTYSGADIETGRWYLVTFVAKNDSSSEPGGFSHTLHVNSTTNSTSIAPHTPGVSDFDRFALANVGESSAETPIGPSCHLEQAAVWDRVLSEAEHDRMFADSGGEFNGLPRSPSEIGVLADGTEKGLGCWVLAGHFRHDIKVDPSTTTAGMGQNQHIDQFSGDLFNESFDGTTLPYMFVAAGSPRWSAVSPHVFFPAVTYTGDPPEHAPRRIPVSRMAPACFFFVKPEKFLTTSTVTTKYPEGTHPIYDDPFCRVFARVSAADCNKPDQSPPYFRTGDYIPATYSTNVARRVADWFAYQGMIDGMGGEADGQHDGCVFVTGVAMQSPGGNFAGNWGRNVGDSKPTGAGSTIKGLGVPLHQHPRDEFAEDTSLNAEPWNNLYHQNGHTLVQQWSEQFYPALKKELDRRALCYPARMHLDLEGMPELRDMVNDVEAGMDKGGYWNYYKYDDLTGVTIATDPYSYDPWHDEVILTDYLSVDWKIFNMWTVNGHGEVEGSGWPYFDQGETYPANKDWSSWLLSWLGEIDIFAVWVGVADPAVDVFGSDLKWSNYYRVIADNPAYPFTMHAWYRTYTSYRHGNQSDFSAPSMYPPPAGAIDPFIEDEEILPHLRSVSRRDVYHRVCRARIDACVNAANPKPLVPWLPGVGWSRKQSSTTIFKLNEPDVRLIMWYAWQRGANEFCFWINAGTEPPSDSDPDGEPGHLEGDEGPTDDMGDIGEYDTTYEVARGVINAIRTCPVYSRDRTMRHCKAWR